MVLSCISASFNSASPSSPNISFEVSSTSMRSTLYLGSLILRPWDGTECSAGGGRTDVFGVASVCLEVVGLVHLASSRKRVRSSAKGEQVQDY